MFHPKPAYLARIPGDIVNKAEILPRKPPPLTNFGGVPNP